MKKLILSLILLSSLCACGVEVGNSNSGDSEDESIINNNNDGNSIGNAGDNPNCPASNSLDGEGGFLWKPNSESDGKLVILFPKKYTVTFKQVLAYKPDGKADIGVFSGFTNDDRQTYRFPQTGRHYTGRVLVDAGNQHCEWFVPDPSSVQD